ncbi:MAG: ATP-binding protein [Pseudomonadota bacterium]
MPWLNDLSIRAKLLWVILLTSSAALVVAGLAIVTYDAIAFRQQRAADLSTQAAILGAISTAALVFNDAKAAREYLSTLKERPDVISAILYDNHGKIFATYQPTDSPVFDPPAVEANGQRMENGDLLLFRSIRTSHETVGTIHLRASLDLEGRLLRYAAIVLMVLVGSLLVALVLSEKLQALVSAPLLAVTQMARNVITHQDYSGRVVKRSEDEVGVLVDAFNQMLAQIEQREVALRVEIAEHQSAREEVAALNQTLEGRVAERTMQLEAVNKELETFAYSVSHDLRAPLRSIDGFTMILQESYTAQLDERGQHYFQRIRAATQRMGHLIDDLLKLSRTVRSEMNFSTVNLSELAQAVAKELQDAAPERKGTFSIAPDVIVHADATLMRTVLENLLGNAWKFTGKCAEARIEVGNTTDMGNTVYFVRDNGVGFDMKYVDKLFGTFQRLHAVTEFEGTGIGLANVQRIIQRHGGKVWANAALGQGATFSFTLSTGQSH